MRGAARAAARAARGAALIARVLALACLADAKKFEMNGRCTALETSQKWQEPSTTGGGLGADPWARSAVVSRKGWRSTCVALSRHASASSAPALKTPYPTGPRCPLNRWYASKYSG